MRIARTVLISAAVFLLGHPDAAAARKKTRGRLKFSISLDKTEYKKSDRIYVNFTLKNEGRKPVYVNKRFHINTEDSPKEEKEVYFIVTGADLSSPLKASTPISLPYTFRYTAVIVYSPASLISK